MSPEFRSTGGGSIKLECSPIQALSYTEIPPCKYTLVVLNGCQLGSRPEWKSAFNADCFVGWKGDAYAPPSSHWETYFWSNIFNQGMGIADAANAALETLQGLADYEQIIEVQNMEIVIHGDSRLPTLCVD